MLFASHDCQQTDQFFEFGFVQPMQGLVYPVPKGGVEFVQQIEPGLGDVAKNLSAVIGGGVPGARASSVPGDPASALYLVPVRSSSLLCPMSEAPPYLRLAGCAGR